MLKSRRTARESHDFRKHEKASKRRQRLVKEYREWELQQKRKKRESVEFKQKEIELQKTSKRKAKSDTCILENERLKKRQWRADIRNKKAENIVDCQRKCFKRKQDGFHQDEICLAKPRKYGSSIAACIIEQFHASVLVYVCSCCHQTWFRQSVTETKSLSEKKKKKI